MDSILKVIAISFAILFIGTTALALVLYNVEHSAFDAELYIRALEEENIYRRLPELTAQSLALAAQRSQDGSVLSLFRNLSEEEWRTFVSDLFPPEILRNFAEDAVAQFIAYLNGERENLVLSLAGLKAHLGSPEGINAIFSMLKSQPDCTIEHVTAMALGKVEMVLCNPPETVLFVDVRPLYEAQIRTAVTVIPEQLTFIPSGAERTQRLQDLRFARMVVRLSPSLPLMCLLMIALFAVRSFRDWLNWWGYPLFLAGLVSMSLSAMSGLFAAGTFQLFIAPALPDIIPQEIVIVFRDLTATIVHNAVRPTLPIAAIMAFLGFMMVVLAFLLRKKLLQSPHYVR